MWETTDIEANRHSTRHTSFECYLCSFGQLDLYSISPVQNACHVDNLHENWRYTEGSAAWVLIASIIVFFMVGMSQS